MEVSQRRTCKKCGFTAPLGWFNRRRKMRDGSNSHYRLNVCPMCQQEARDKKKLENRELIKARAMAYHSALKFNKASDMKLNTTEFMDIFGWPSYEKIAQLIKEKKNGHCPICTHPFDVETLGLNNITLDHTIPGDFPYWLNMRFICRTCNVQKSDKPLEKHGADLALIKQRYKFLSMPPELGGNPQHKMRLGL